MDLQLEGKPIVVTGGGSGIGAAITMSLAGGGAVPVILGRDPLPAAFESALRARQPRFTFHGVEATRESECRAAVDAASRQHGAPHRLVNNAGVNDHVGLEAGREAVLQSIDRHLTQVHVMAHLMLRHRRATHGPIVKIGSKTSLTGQGGTSGCIAAKGAILGLAREWAEALCGDRFRVNTVVPSEVMTPTDRAELARLPDPEAARATIEQRIPFGRRTTTPEEIADLVVPLLSPCSSHATGQSIVVDGGHIHLDRAIGHEA